MVGLDYTCDILYLVVYHCGILPVIYIIPCGISLWYIIPVIYNIPCGISLWYIIPVIYYTLWYITVVNYTLWYIIPFCGISLW